MNKELTDYEELLIELTHFMARDGKLSLRELKKMLVKPMHDRKGMNCLECLEEHGRGFLNELITYVNEIEQSVDKPKKPS